MENQKKPNSGKWIGMGCLIPSVLIIAAIIGGMIYLYKQVILDPEKIEPVARSIFSFNIPGGSRGVFAMDMQGSKTAMMQSKKKPPDSFLVLASFPREVAEDAKGQFEKSVLRKFTNDSETSITYSKIIQDKLCGKNVSVKMQRGYMRRGKKVDRDPMTSFQTAVTNQGKLKFVLVIAAGKNSDARARGIYKSLRCPAGTSPSPGGKKQSVEKGDIQ